MHINDSERFDVTNVLGNIGDPRFCGMVKVFVDVAWGDARKHRQVLQAADGREVRVQLARGVVLEDGAVLAAGDEEVLVVRRPAEPAVTVDFASNAGSEGARRMLLLGYLLGNQHAPLDVTAERVATPLMTTAGTALDTLAELCIVGDVTNTPLARHGWSNTSADHHHSHSHD